jgi:hypothetical protein
MCACAPRVLLATVACLAVHGCDAVNGGAVELSWKLRPASSSDDDKFVDCKSGKLGTGTVTAIRLEWSVGGVASFDQWDCSAEHGVTRFDLPPGTALLSVAPRCGVNGELAAEPKSYIAPALEQRDVIVGDIVSLGAVELVVVVSYCDQQTCICR